MSVEYTADEMMSIAAARALADGASCFVGIGLPSKAANLAWVMERLPKHSKIVLWAHNNDVARADSAMGDWLAKRLGKPARCGGLAVWAGQSLASQTPRPSRRK